MDALEPDKFGDLFNSLLETGIRAVVILEAIRPEAADLSEMILFDHVVVHAAEWDGPKSLHTKLPDRKAELLVRRSLIESSLELMQRSHLVEIETTEEGFVWRASEDAAAYIDLLESGYSQDLRQCADWISEQIAMKTKQGFKAFIREQLNDW